LYTHNVDVDRMNKQELGRIIGKPKTGYVVAELIQAIETFLGWNNVTEAFLVGAGNLGTALLGYQGFQNFGFRIVGVFDHDPKVIGQWIHGRKVQGMDQLAPFARRGEILLGELTVPAGAAPQLARTKNAIERTLGG